MANATNFLGEFVVDHVITGGYIALFSAVANPDTGSVTELTGSGYARVAIGDKFPTVTGTGGAISNNAAIEFPAATADWTPATHFGVYDAITAGNLLCVSALTQPVTGLDGQQVRFLAGKITLTMA